MHLEWFRQALALSSFFCYRGLANLGHEVADETVGNILKRHGIPGRVEGWRGAP